MATTIKAVLRENWGVPFIAVAMLIILVAGILVSTGLIVMAYNISITSLIYALAAGFALQILSVIRGGFHRGLPIEEGGAAGDFPV